MMKKLIVLLLFLMMTATANAQDKKPLNELLLVADNDEGTFLGTFEDESEADSIFNERGNYGSRYSSTSIFNQFSQYGSQFSAYSAFNEFASHPPIIMDDKGNVYGRLSINSFVRGVTDQSYQLAKRLMVRWNALNK